MLKRMTKLWLLVPPVVLLVAIVAACASNEPGQESATEAPSAAIGQRVETEDGSYINVTPEELRSMLDSKDFPLVNVHIPYEGEIEGTDLFIPYNQIAGRLDELPPEKDAKIVVYCRSGRMSAVAAETLVSHGYTNVWNLDGGMIAWEEVGYPLLNAGG
ncbi:MAG: rhodanese-like domain-containing protein [Chloroflexota bacterium]|nr:rhodanese-like domain-containing protein [Chloroflexota bacterium]